MKIECDHLMKMYDDGNNLNKNHLDHSESAHERVNALFVILTKNRFHEQPQSRTENIRASV
jgi:hypothetical protein